MRALALVMCMVAACGGDEPSGAVVVVSAPADLGVTFVKLYTALPTPGMDVAQTITPEGFEAAGVVPAAGSVLQREVPVLDLLALSPGGEARFGFQSTGVPARLAAVVALGYAEDGAGGYRLVGAAQARGVEIDETRIVVHRLELGPVTDPTRDPGATGRRAHVWGAPAADVPDTCLYFEDPTFPVDAGRTLLIVADAERDPDCDGHLTGTAVECAPLAYQGETGDNGASEYCLVQDPATTPDGDMLTLCRLGRFGATCIDGRGPVAPMCRAEAICIEQALCEACTANAMDPAACVLEGTVAPFGSIDRATFVIATGTYTLLENAVQVEPGTKTLDLAAALPALAGMTCTDIRLQDPQGNLSQDIDVPAGGPFQLRLENTGCVIAVTLSTTGIAPSSTEHLHEGLLAIDIDAGTAQSELLLPFRVRLAQGTSAALALGLGDPSDTLPARGDVAVCLAMPLP